MKCNLHFNKIGVDFIGKIGRNDPCKCGSGKKYKKCCIQKNIEIQNQLTINRCVVCSKKMDIEEVDRIFTRKINKGGVKLEVTVPICSDECNLAFELKEVFNENPDWEAYQVITQFWTSDQFSNEDMKTAIGILIENEESPLKQDLIDYLEHAKLHRLYED